MQQQLAWAAGRAGEEDWLLSAQSDTEAYFSRLTKAREFSQRAVATAVHADAKETAALWQVNAALREAEFDNVSSARENATAALTLMPGRDIRSVAALALARAGEGAQAQKLADSLNKIFPRIRSFDVLSRGPARGRHGARMTEVCRAGFVRSLTLRTGWLRSPFMRLVAPSLSMEHAISMPPRIGSASG